MLSETLARVDALKVELDVLRPLKPEHQQRLRQKLRLEWNFNSNHIEGNTLTYGETFLLLIHGQINGGHSMREFEEMKAHDVAVATVTDWSADQNRKITESDVRSLNEILLKEPFWKEAITPDGQRTQIQVVPGKYKETSNSVLQPDGTLFHYASPDEVPAMMAELMEWYKAPSDLHPIQKVAMLHHRFILIHPFGDGNGRTARLLVNYHLMHHGYMPLVVKSEDKSNYLRCLKLADAGDLNPFIEYLTEQEQWALDLAIRAAKGLGVDEVGDWRKEAELLYRDKSEEHRQSSEKKVNSRQQIATAIQQNYDLVRQDIEEKIFFFRKFYRTATGVVTIEVLDGRQFKSKNFNILGAKKEQLIELFMKHETKPRIMFHLNLQGQSLPVASHTVKVLFLWNFGKEHQSLVASLPEKTTEMHWAYGLTFQDAGLHFFDDLAKSILRKVAPNK